MTHFPMVDVNLDFLLRETRAVAEWSRNVNLYMAGGRKVPLPVGRLLEGSMPDHNSNPFIVESHYFPQANP